MADDVVQEALTRLIEVRHRLESRTLAAYAAVTVRNLVASTERERDVARRYRHRLLDPPTVEDASVEVEGRDEARLIVDVLAQLDVDDRQLLQSRVLDETSTGELAARSGSSSSGLAVRLTRLRARARVEYAVALYGQPLPEDDCRPVLLSLASADKRRQAQLATAEHLRSCPCCAELAEHVVAGRRPVFVMVPVLLLARVKRFFQEVAPTTGGVATGVGVVLVAAIATALWVANPDPDPPPPSREPIERPLTLDGQPVVGDWAARTRRRPGAPVRGRGLEVQRVVTDEGMWVSDGGQRIWVELVGEAESPFRVRAGQLVSFDGVVRRHGAGFVESLDVQRADRRGLLAAGVHIAVPIRQWRIADGASP